ncbi:CaiB/BaiF CoA transferase family protein [Methylobacterium aquaticum]|uniref:Formyl-CoA transferase n=1 Tax=Methylobacterium aquaticum TaxID=270351 RepID=A0A0C6G1Q9_9HYPH|nr:CoA transferase [Methylobacterium aquaticum]BAQ49900.1 formyl-CoA transferase [Methylobacterium aquaticum]
MSDDQPKPDTRPLPLAGVTVVDLSQIYNGPYATFLLAAAGADVIKIEPPGGESLRRRGVVGGAALPFAMLNGFKQSLVLDLKTEDGKAILRDLAAGADIVVENFAPGVMDRLGLGCDALQAINPRLIYAQSSGYGSSGPYRDYPAMDLTVQAMAGVMSITGFPDRPPVKAGPALCDFFAGTHLYGAIVTALYERERTGTGRRVEVAMLDAVYPSLSSSLGLHFGSGGDVPTRTGNRHGGLAEAPYNVYPTRDGFIAIICVGEGHWRALLTAMERPDLADDPRFGSLKDRVAHVEEIDRIVGAWTGGFDKQPLFELLMRHRVACAPVRNLDEVVNDPHLHARGALQWIDHPDLGRIVVQHSPLRFDGSELRPLAPSRRLGADGEAILEERLGRDPEAVASLKAKGVI